MLSRKPCKFNTHPLDHAGYHLNKSLLMIPTDEGTKCSLSKRGLLRFHTPYPVTNVIVYANHPHHFYEGRNSLGVRSKPSIILHHVLSWEIQQLLLIDTPFFCLSERVLLTTIMEGRGRKVRPPPIRFRWGVLVIADTRSRHRPIRPLLIAAIIVCRRIAAISII